VNEHDVEALRAIWQADIREQNNRTVEVLLMIQASADPREAASVALQNMLVREAQDILAAPENTPEKSLLRSLLDRAGRTTLPPVEPPG
jgi:hypothetical protein